MIRFLFSCQEIEHCTLGGKLHIYHQSLAGHLGADSVIITWQKMNLRFSSISTNRFTLFFSTTSYFARILIRAILKFADISEVVAARVRKPAFRHTRRESGDRDGPAQAVLLGRRERLVNPPKVWHYPPAASRPHPGLEKRKGKKKDGMLQYFG